MKKNCVGFIGLGQISALHRRAYLDAPGVELVAIADCNEQVLRRRGREWGIERCYADYLELLACEDISAVEVLVPHPFHEEVVCAAAAAGKHISCQKPLTTSLASAQRIRACCAEHKVKFKLYENYLYYPPLVKARELLASGLVGEPNSLRISMVSGGSGGWSIAGTTWQWRLDETRAGRGRETFDHGHHLWAVALDLLGPVESVQSQIFVDDEGVDSPASIFWRHKSQGRFGSCDYSRATQLHFPSTYYACDESFAITGERGMIWVNGCSGGLFRDRPAVQSYTNSGWQEYPCERDWAASFIGCSHNFFKMLDEETDPYPDASLACEILALDLAISDSARSGTSVTLNELPPLSQGGSE